MQLVIDGVLRPVRVLLNNQTLGEAIELWKPTEFDITPSLQPKNMLELQFHDAPQNPIYPSYFLDKGVREGVYLQIESRKGRWKSKRIAHVPAMPTDHTALLGEWESKEDIEGIAKVTQEGHLLSSFRFESPAGKSSIEMPLGLRDWPRWHVRSQGMPHRVKLDVTIIVEDQIVHEESFETGLPGTFAPLIEAHAMELTPEQAYSPNLGYPPTLPVADWDIARSDTVILNSFLGPKALYSLMDRIGLRVVHGGLPTADQSAIMPLLGMHPCVQAGKV